VREIGLPRYEHWDEQFYPDYHHDGCSRCPGEVPGGQAAEAAEKDRATHDPEEHGLALDVRHNPPDDDGQTNIPTGHESKLAIQIWRCCFSGNIELDTPDQAEYANGERQQTQNRNDDLKGALHLASNENKMS
jgi:hypothetical protein